MVMQRKNRNKIIRLKISNGSCLTDHEDIKSAMIDFYKSFLGTSITQRTHSDGSIIAADPILDEVACVDLCKPVSAEEIKESMFSIPGGKAPGPDGFNCRFFQKNWSTIGSDVIEAVREFFRTGKLLGQINITTLTIIPKSQAPETLSDHRPIAFCNVLLKCITRILTTKISKYLNVIVSQS